MYYVYGSVRAIPTNSMTSMEFLLKYELFIKRCVEKGETYSAISLRLKSMLPRTCGLSERRFCKEQNIHPYSNAQLDSITAAAVESVGHSYRRKTMQGLLHSWESVNLILV